MKNHMKILFVVSLIIVSFTANAQFVNSLQSDFITVKEIKKHAFHLAWTDQKVSLNGKIVEQFDEESYWFEDGTGRIKVEIPRKNMPAVQFDHNTVVALSGEVHYTLIKRTEIEVMQVVFPAKQ